MHPKAQQSRQRLHYPVDVDTVMKDLRTPQSVFYSGRVLFISDTEADRIVYLDLDHATVLKVKAMKKAQLLAECVTRGLIEGDSGETVPKPEKAPRQLVVKNILGPGNDNREINVQPPHQETWCSLW